jgi:hypothetical protein
MKKRQDMKIYMGRRWVQLTDQVSGVCVSRGKDMNKRLLFRDLTISTVCTRIPGLEVTSLCFFALLGDAQ